MQALSRLFQPKPSSGGAGADAGVAASLPESSINYCLKTATSAHAPANFSDFFKPERASDGMAWQNVGTLMKTPDKYRAQVDKDCILLWVALTENDTDKTDSVLQFVLAHFKPLALRNDCLQTAEMPADTGSDVSHHARAALRQWVKHAYDKARLRLVLRTHGDVIRPLYGTDKAAFYRMLCAMPAREYLDFWRFHNQQCPDFGILLLAARVIETQQVTAVVRHPFFHKAVTQTGNNPWRQLQSDVLRVLRCVGVASQDNALLHQCVRGVFSDKTVFTHCKLAGCDASQLVAYVAQPGRIGQWDSLIAAHEHLRTYFVAQPAFRAIMRAQFTQTTQVHEGGTSASAGAAEAAAARL